MRAIIALIAVLFFLFCFPPIKSVLSAITFTISNPQLNGEEVTFEVSIAGLTSSSCPNTTCFLQAALTPQAITSYFGYTKNHNGEWFEYISSPETDYIKSTFFAFEPQTGSWSGTLTIRPEITNSNYVGTNIYNIKAWRYTGNSKSYSGSSDTVSIELTAPTPTPTATPTPTPTASPTNTPTPTPTKTPTPTPTRSPTPTPTLVLPTDDVLGESTESGEIVSPTDAESFNEDASVSNKTKNTTNNLPKILMLIVGIIFSTACGILIFLKHKNKDIWFWTKKST